MFLIIATVIALVAQILLTLVVWLKDTKALRNRAFFLLSISLLAWAVANFVTETFPDVTKTVNSIRLIMLFAVLQNCFFVLFTRSLQNREVRATKGFIAYVVLSTAACAFTLSPFVFSDLAVTASGALYPIVGPGMGVFVVHAIISIGLGFRSLISRLRHVSGVWRRQTLYILVGSIVLWGIVPLTNFVLSVTLQTSFFANLSPLYAFVFSGIIAYAIIKHRLFDIRTAIARTVVYLFLLITLASLYAVIVFSITLLFFQNSTFNLEQSAVYITAAVFLAFTFGSLHAFFNRLTNKIFFKDAYETKTVLDTLGSTLVSAVEISQLSRQSLLLLQQALKSAYIGLVLLETSDMEARFIVVGDKKGGLPRKLVEQMGKQPGSIYVLEDLEDHAGALYQTMEHANCAVIARLETTQDVIGYVIFGYKASGNAYTNQDIDLIRIAVDELAVAAQNALRFEEIARFNITLSEQVDAATKQLRSSNAKLQQLDQAKDEFISMASHQLRTPLTSVKGYLSMVLEGDAGNLNPDQRKLLQEAYSSSQRMVYLIGDFLNVSRLQTGRFMVERKTVDLPELIKEEVDQLVSTAARRKLKLVFSAPKTFPDVEVDPNKIRQVVMNFIDNAIFYSKPNTTVKVELESHVHEVCFKVTDSGIGVPIDEQPKLFTKFFRASNARNVRPDGTGIGLFMAKKVVDSHGGRLIFKTRENKGSTFGFCIPRPPKK